MQRNEECVSLRRLRKYLGALSRERADPYDMWIKVLTCVYICNADGFDLADEWSQVSGKYVSRDDVFKHWKTSKGDLNMGLGMLIEFIKEDNPGDKYIISKLDYVEYEAITPRYYNINEKIIDVEYLTSEIYKGNDIVVCKSGTGTRKSASAAVCCNEEGGKVLVVGSFATFVFQEVRSFHSEHIVKQFGENHISLVKYHEKHLDIKNDRGIAMTLSSLSKFEQSTIEELKEFTVVIDEANSLMTLLLGSETVAPKCIYLYWLLKRILVNCKKIIMIDADISDIVFEFLNFIIPLRENKKAIFVRNVRRDYSGIKAIKVNEKELIERMKKDIAMGIYFVVCFDSRKEAKKLFDMMSDKQNEENFVLIYGESCDEVDPERLKNKWVFYSPRVEKNGLDYIPKDSLAETVYILMSGENITPLQVNRHTTRNRIMKRLIYCITAEPKNLKYESVDALEKDVDGWTPAMKNLMKNQGVRFYDFWINPNIKKDVEEFVKLFYIAEYHKNIFAVDFCRHFETILLENGFEIEV